MRLGSIVLPAMVWGKVDDFATVVPIGTAKAKAEGFGPNQSGPLGFRATGARFGGLLGLGSTTAFATLRVDRLAVREIELTEPDLILLRVNRL